MINATPKGFQNNPAVRWLSWDSEKQALLEPLVYVSGAGVTYTVPEGFVTDYASIPRIFWNILPPDGDAKFPAILHDYLYSLRGAEPYGASRHACDDLLLEAMQLIGVGLLQRRVIYRAVRIFGGLHSLAQPWVK